MLELICTYKLEVLMTEVHRRKLTQSSLQVTIPANSVSLEKRLVIDENDHMSEKLYAQFQLRHRTAAWVLEDIAEVLVSIVNDGFGIEFVRPDGGVQANRLVVSTDVYLEFMAIWRTTRESAAEIVSFQG